MVTPNKGLANRTKHTWITFFNKEAEQVLNEYLLHEKPTDDLFPAKSAIRKAFRKVNKTLDKKITPQVLRQWFACELGKLGVPDRYVDAFCGRVPREPSNTAPLTVIAFIANPNFLFGWHALFFLCTIVRTMICRNLTKAMSTREHTALTQVSID
jgi:hypothetical protein